MRRIKKTNPEKISKITPLFNSYCIKFVMYKVLRTNLCLMYLAFYESINTKRWNI
jgi:hypothetical protein